MLQRLHVRLAYFQGRQIGVWEKAVILRILFGTHHTAFSFCVVPAACLLLYHTAPAHHGHLPPRLVLDGAVNRAEAADVFHLGARAEFLPTARPDRDVHIRADASLLHFCIGDAKRQQDARDCFQKDFRLFGTAQIRFGDDLDQRYAAAVIIRKDPVRGIVVHQLACVLFQLDARDPDAPHYAVHQNLHRSVLAQGHIPLCDLVRLGQIGIKIVFAVEPAYAVDRAA